MVSMNFVPNLQVPNHLQEPAASLSFSGETVVVQPVQEPETSGKGLAMGLALAAAAGIGFLARKPKVVEKIVQQADDAIKPVTKKAGDIAETVTKKADDVDAAARKLYQDISQWEADKIKYEKAKNALISREIAEATAREKELAKMKEDAKAAFKPILQEASEKLNNAGKKVNKTPENMHNATKRVNTAKTGAQFDKIEANAEKVIKQTQKQAETARETAALLNTQSAKRQATRIVNKAKDAERDLAKLVKKIEGDPSVDLAAETKKIMERKIHGKNVRKQQNIIQKRIEDVKKRSMGSKAYEAEKAANQAAAEAARTTPKGQMGVLKQILHEKEFQWVGKQVRALQRKMSSSNLTEKQALELIIKEHSKYGAGTVEAAQKALGKWTAQLQKA